MHTLKGTLATLATLVVLALPAAAQAPASPTVPEPAPAVRTFGTWVIRRDPAVAPWVPQGVAPPADSYQRSLVGGRVTFGADRITGPAPLACRGPRYLMRDYGADLLFQGNLNRAETQATALGFATRPIKTLETSCAGAIDFHMVNADTMLFALNNRIYTLDRVRPSPRR